MRFVRRALGLTISLALVGAVLLVTAAAISYHRLTEETLIAELRFAPAGPDRYQAYLRTGDRCEERVLPILGDQWRVDAEFVKWKYWATALLGVESQYRLDRLEGRYRSVEEQNTKPRLAHDLEPGTTLDLVELAETLGRFNFLLDTSYGSSTYRGIDPALVYEIYKTPTAIITRSRPAPVPPAAGLTALPVAVARACGDLPSGWQRWLTWMDRSLASWIRPATAPT